MNLEEFLDKFKGISKQGYVKSKRRGNTGVGYTLEKMLGIDENNISAPDLGKIELKAHRENSSSMITLFTFDRNVWLVDKKTLIQKYGNIDNRNRKSLYCTVTPIVNPSRLYYDLKCNCLQLTHISGIKLVKWFIDNIVNKLRNKLYRIILVQAKTKFMV